MHFNWKVFDALLVGMLLVMLIQRIIDQETIWIVIDAALISYYVIKNKENIFK